MSNGCKTSTTDEDGTDSIDKIVHGIDIGGHIGPRGHGARRCEKSAEQQDADHEEPHDEDGLLHGVAMVADNKPEG